MYSMNEELIKNADACYRLAEQKAAHYFKSLYVQVMEKDLCPYSNKRYTIVETQPYSSSFIIILFFAWKGKTGFKGVSQLYPMAGLYRETR